MGLNTQPESSTGILGAIKGALGLFSDQNKAMGVTENSNPTPIDPYESTLDEREVMELIAQWKRDYSVYYQDIEKGQKLSFDYWVGKQKTDRESQTGDDTQVIDNLIFEAVETFLPIATRANPEPLVQADPSDQGQAVAKDIRVALTNWADTQLLRRKLAKTTRGWLMNRLGALKLAWNPITKEIELSVVNTKKMMFDKDGWIDEKGVFRGEYEAEKKQATADKLMQMFPKKKEQILAKAMGKKGTKLDYVEWWYRGTDIIFTLDTILLGKFKNPNWNYDINAVQPTEAVTNEVGEIVTDAQEGQDSIPGTNHLKERTSPYRYLSIFNTGEQPHDNTSLILQNISLQDSINRRERQIEFNVKRMNNGGIVSGDFYTEEQASQAASAFARGVFIRQPKGDVRQGFLNVQAPAIPGDVFNSLKDGRQELRNIFGTAGSSAEGLKSSETARGKIMVNQMDSSRIGGGVTEYIEQLADSIYNLVVQFMFVYYDEEHFIATAGSVSGIELVTLKNQNFVGLKTLDVTVKEGTLVPKDPLTQRNEAIDLWSAGAIDPINLFKKLDFPNPQEATSQLILWQMLQKGQIQPQQYLPTFAPMGGTPGQAPMEQPGVGGPAVNTLGAGSPEAGQQAPAPGSQGAVEQQSQQLMSSIPIPK